MLHRRNQKLNRIMCLRLLKNAQSIAKCDVADRETKPVLIAKSKPFANKLHWPLRALGKRLHPFFWLSATAAAGGYTFVNDTYRATTMSNDNDNKHFNVIISRANWSGHFEPRNQTLHRLLWVWLNCELLQWS